MKTKTQEYKVLIEIDASIPIPRDLSDVLEEALETGLLPEDGIALVSVEASPNN